jgi:hypothetical protein
MTTTGKESNKKENKEKNIFGDRLQTFQQEEAKRREKKLAELLDEIFKEILPQFIVGLAQLKMAIQNQKSYESALKGIVKELDPIQKDDIIDKMKKLTK